MFFKYKVDLDKSEHPALVIHFNSLPNNKILALTKMEAFADDKIIVTQKLKLVLGRVENTVEKWWKC